VAAAVVDLSVVPLPFWIVARPALVVVVLVHPAKERQLERLQQLEEEEDSEGRKGHQSPKEGNRSILGVYCNLASNLISFRIVVFETHSQDFFTRILDASDASCCHAAIKTMTML
jgi:hypothetical protein